jgi:hypothetical protein
MENTVARIFALTTNEHLLSLIKTSRFQFGDCAEKFITYYKKNFDERFISAQNKANSELKKMVKKGQHIDEETNKLLAKFFTEQIELEARKFAQEIFDSEV